LDDAKHLDIGPNTEITLIKNKTVKYAIKYIYLPFPVQVIYNNKKNKDAL
jgi:hypothetical protein